MRHLVFAKPIALCALALCVLAVAMDTSTAARAQIPIRAGAIYVQNFNTLGAGAAVTLPDGFRADAHADVRTIGTFARAGTATTHRGGDLMPADAPGGIYNFGSGDPAHAGDRAVGFAGDGAEVRSGNLYAQFVNETGAPPSDLYYGRCYEVYRTNGNREPTVAAAYFSYEDVYYQAIGGGVTLPGNDTGLGFSDAPGADACGGGTISLGDPIPVGGVFYVAIHYSVARGTSAENLAAIGIDEFILAPGRASFQYLWVDRLERSFVADVPGQTSAPQRVAVHYREPNAAGVVAPELDLAGAHPEDFSVSLVGSTGASAWTYAITFTPVAAGTRTASLTFRVGDAVTETVLLHGTANALPVELVRFDALVQGADVLLTWTTASETNNAGFEIEHEDGGGWRQIGFVAGHGTTLEGRAYRYPVTGLVAGRHRFRLRQMDYDGAFAYSPAVEGVIDVVEAYQLSAPYPNPFDLQTSVTLAVRATQHVRVAVYDALGRQVALLHDDVLAAGDRHRFTFDGAGLPGGLYLLHARSASFRATRQMLLAR